MIEELIKTTQEEYRNRSSKPSALIGNDRTVTNFIISLCGGEPDWKSPIYLQLIEEDENSVIRVLRSVDIESNNIVLL